MSRLSSSPYPSSPYPYPLSLAVSLFDLIREELTTPDGGLNTLDWCVPPKGVVYAADTPTVIILHGLTGGACPALPLTSPLPHPEPVPPTRP